MKEFDMRKDDQNKMSYIFRCGFIAQHKEWVYKSCRTSVVMQEFQNGQFIIKWDYLSNRMTSKCTQLKTDLLPIVYAPERSSMLWTKAGSWIYCRSAS